MNRNQPLLSISLLASNRPDTIRKCLDSLRVLREAISCELILIDTSGVKEIHDILCEYTDQVYPFVWCNDFSKARNEGLKRAKGEWFLFLDDDEWLIDGEEIIRFFKSGEYGQYGYANYIVRNYMDVRYSTYSDSPVTRMIRLEEDTEFRSKIHEYLAPMRGKCKDLTALVGHSGYIYETEEKKRAHFLRNYQLLLEMLSAEPDNGRWKMQIVQELSAIGDWEKLLGFCKKQIAKCENCSRKELDAYDRAVIDAYCAGYIQGLLQLHRYEECLDFCQETKTVYKSEAILDTYLEFYRGRCYYGIGKWKDAEGCMEAYLQQRKRLLADKEALRPYKGVALLGAALDDKYVHAAYQTFICAGLKQGRTEALQVYYGELGFEKSVMSLEEGVKEALFDAIISLEPEEITVKLLEDVYGNGPLRTFFSERFWEKMKAENENESRLLAHYGAADVLHGDMLFARAYPTGNEKEQAELIKRYENKRLAEQAVLQDMDGMSDEEVERLFCDFTGAVLDYYSYICPEEWLDTDSAYLPEEGKGALVLHAMFAKEPYAVEEKIADLKVCAHYLPRFGEQIKRLAEGIARQKPQGISRELLQMVQTMKGNIRFMAEQGLTREALDVLRQVQNLAPWDEELKVLEKELKE